jgi:hypothetical protein
MRVYHFGHYNGKITPPFYVSEDKRFIASHEVRKTHSPEGNSERLCQFELTPGKTAPEKLVQQIFKVIAGRENHFTSASVFDKKLHDEEHVDRLVKTLRDDLGYDTAKVADINPHGEESDVIVVLNPKSLRPTLSEQLLRECHAH